MKAAFQDAMQGKQQDVLNTPSRGGGRPLETRPIAVHGVGDEDAGAHDAEECGNCFKHGIDP